MGKYCIGTIGDTKVRYDVADDAVKCSNGNVPKDYCIPSSEWVSATVSAIEDSEELRQFYRELGSGVLAAIPAGRVAQIAIKAAPKVAAVGGSLVGFEASGHASRAGYYDQVFDGEYNWSDIPKFPFAVAEATSEIIGMNATKAGGYLYAQGVTIGDEVLGTGLTCEGQGIYLGDEKYPTQSNLIQNLGAAVKTR